tara:strand:- start:51189 stop:51731 length:543 start_codon:yes stop_codon:yes gene_type:complete
MTDNEQPQDSEELSPKEKYDLEKANKAKAKQHAKAKKKLADVPKKAGKYILISLTVLVILGSIMWLFTLVPNLPPITVEGHSEDSPAAHIVTSPLPDRMQRHMLEHSDGRGAPGIIIQYNCLDYECEPDLIGRLTAIADDYPENVYLAPNTYDGKIIMTRAGKREVLEVFDADKIREFVQ